MNEDFEILGVRVRYKSSPSGGAISTATENVLADRLAEKAVKLLNSEIAAMKEHSPESGQMQMLLLAALKLAEDKIILEEEFRNSMDKMSGMAR
ncbi:MAG: cell division protein ZapA, partial [Oligoflexia bacterium]|nr:cell division protein ZapA [Oligoflexia bacterium]